MDERIGVLTLAPTVSCLILSRRDLHLRNVSAPRSDGNEQKGTVVERPGRGTAAGRLARDHRTRFASRYGHEIQTVWRAGGCAVERDLLAVVRPRSPPVIGARRRRRQSRFLAALDISRPQRHAVGGLQPREHQTPSIRRPRLRAERTQRRESIEVLKVRLRDPPACSAGGRHPIDVHAGAIVRHECDPGTVRRPARHGLVVGAARDETTFSTPQRHDGNIHRSVRGVVVGHLRRVGRPAPRQREPVGIRQRGDRQGRRARPGRCRAGEAPHPPRRRRDREDTENGRAHRQRTPSRCAPRGRSLLMVA